MTFLNAYDISSWEKVPLKTPSPTLYFDNVKHPLQRYHTVLLFQDRQRGRIERA